MFFLKPLRLDAWHTRAARLGVGASLWFDVPAAYPGASCILLLVYAYAPFPAGERLSAYYLASQRGYLASQELVKALCASGIPCEIAAVPARALALANAFRALYACYKRMYAAHRSSCNRILSRSMRCMYARLPNGRDRTRRD